MPRQQKWTTTITATGAPRVPDATRAETNLSYERAVHVTRAIVRVCWCRVSRHRRHRLRNSLLCNLLRSERRLLRTAWISVRTQALPRSGRRRLCLFLRRRKRRRWRRRRRFGRRLPPRFLLRGSGHGATVLAQSSVALSSTAVIANVPKRWWRSKDRVRTRCLRRHGGVHSVLSAGRPWRVLIQRKGDRGRRLR